jgi:C1A family cysteine protease
MAAHKFGWKPSYPDPRNVPADVRGITVASEVDPRDNMQDPYDQGNLGSCTANAIAGAIEYHDILNGNSFGTPSRLFIYYGERVREGTVGSDSGAIGHDGFKVARKTGVPPETDWPYNINRFREKPPQQAYDDASQHRITDYRHPLQTQAAIKAVLSNQQTVAFGFTVFESFESNAVAKTGVVPVPDPYWENDIGGHEVLIVGYLKSEPNYALVRNSWGTHWGLRGYCLFPWSYILDSQLATDFRTIYRPIS